MLTNRNVDYQTAIRLQATPQNYYHDHFGWFRTVFGRFRTVLDRFRTVSDGFGSCRTVFGSFSNRLRSVSDRFGRFWYAFRPFSDDSTQNLKISNFNWPGLEPVRAVPSVRAVPPSPGQLKFEILRKIRKKTERKRKRKRNGIFVSQHLGDVVNRIAIDGYRIDAVIWPMTFSP